MKNFSNLHSLVERFPFSSRADLGTRRDSNGLKTNVPLKRADFIYDLIMATRLLILGILAVCISVTICSVGIQVRSWESRYRHLINRYLSNSKDRSSMLSRPGRTWLCRRGTAIAVCGSDSAHQRRRNKRIHRRPRVAPARSVTISRHIDNEYKCSNTTCIHGTCQSNKCSCQKGWMGQRCGLDINECSSRTHSCRQKCVNKQGSYRCSCYTGYRPLYGGKRCIKSLPKHPRLARPAALRARAAPSLRQRSAYFTSRTAYKNSTSPYARVYPKRRRLYYKSRTSQSCKTGCRYKCTHHGGVEKCYCPKGFSLASNKVSCIDINECLDISNSECPANQECVNTYGSYTCKCRTGYVMTRTLYGKYCKDANECLNGDNECGVTATCVNTVGSYACECEDGLLKATNNRDCVSAENGINGNVYKPPLVEYSPEDDLQ